MFQNGFLGTDAPLIADITLIAEIIFFMALCAGVIAQRRRHYKLHDRIQAPVVVLNLFLIILVMVTSFMRQQVASTLPQRPTDPYYLVVAIHATLGFIAEGLAIYCLLAGYKILPRKIGRLRYWMWTTFIVWTTAVTFGVITYYVWYMRPLPTPEAAAVETAVADPAAAVTDATGAPVPQQRFLQNFSFVPPQFDVVAGTEVTWINQDGAPHNVTFLDGSAASSNFFQGESFSATFDQPGTFQIYCTLHGNADGTGMATVVNVLEATAANLAVVAAEPTPNPVPPTPTPAPEVAPPPIALLQADKPTQVVLGAASFADQLAVSDLLTVLLTGIPAPAAGTELQAWMINSGTGQFLPLGAVVPDASGAIFLQYADPQQQNLLALYDRFQITQEPQFDDDPTPGQVVYSGQQPPEAFGHLRTITVSSSDAPDGQAYGLGARRQAEELIRHVEFINIAFELLSIADAQRHAEHVINILEGEQGEFFGDHDVAHGIQNPGDGYGVLRYVQQMQAAAVAASQAADTTEAIRVHASHVQMSTANALEWGTLLRGAALQIMETKDIGTIGPQVQTINENSQLLLNGADLNGDGEVVPPEGGIFTAYQHAQYMTALAIVNSQ